MRIRLAEPGDVAAIRDLLVRTWHDTYDALLGAERVKDITDRWHSLDSLTRQLASPLSLFLVAEGEARLIGTSKATGQRDGAVTLDRLYVDPGTQRMGVGAALLAATERAFPYAGRLALEVDPRNGKAIAFYRKQGFQLSEPRTDAVDAGGLKHQRMEKPYPGRNAAALMLRPVRHDDAQDLIGLIGLCFAEYPGCHVDLHDDIPDIVRPARSRLATEGLFLVVEDASGRACACAGVDIPEPGVAELHRLYVRPDRQGRGLAKLLTRRMEDAARERGAARMVMWSDTRFAKAHALYEGLGYQRGASRSLGDISQSREFFFAKAL